MVEGQLRPNKVTDPVVLDAFKSLPREKFVPEAMRGAAYVDEDLPLGNGRFLMEPMVLARLLQSAELRPNYSALEIGSATGYGAAVLAKAVHKVVALESEAALAKQARVNLGDAGIAGVSVMEGPFELGYPQRGPYDVILISGAVAAIPATISDQLSSNGVILAVLKPEGSFMGQAVLMERADGVISKRILFDAGTPILPGFASVPAFSFD